MPNHLSVHQPPNNNNRRAAAEADTKKNGPQCFPRLPLLNNDFLSFAIHISHWVWDSFSQSVRSYSSCPVCVVCFFVALLHFSFCYSSPVFISNFFVSSLFPTVHNHWRQPPPSVSLSIKTIFATYKRYRFLGLSFFFAYCYSFISFQSSLSCRVVYQYNNFWLQCVFLVLPLNACCMGANEGSCQGIRYRIPLAATKQNSEQWRPCSLSGNKSICCDRTISVLPSRGLFLPRQ